jgi:hypothetical protein
MIKAVRLLPGKKSSYCFLSMKTCRRIYLYSSALFLFISSGCASDGIAANVPGNDYIKLSGQFVTSIEKGVVPAAELDLIKTAPQQELEKQLCDEARKKAFWINLYNGFAQLRLKQDISSSKDKRAFFKDRICIVAGHALSLDDIEQGLLRGLQTKQQTGNPARHCDHSFEEKFGVRAVDYRIHFALNCGARSCPAVTYYSPATLDTQLDRAARAYLATETDYDRNENIIYLPEMFSWYWADFGYEKGLRKMLRHYGIIGEDERPEIRFKKFDWTPAPARFR